MGPVNRVIYKPVLNPEVPRHVSIIMDGNGRWARRRRLPRIAGHRAGAQAAKEIVRAAGKLGIQVLTLFAFSTENWRRPQAEIDALMMLLEEYIRRETQELMDNNVRFQVIGRMEGLPDSVRGKLEQTIELTAGNTGMILNLALNYSGRMEIVDAARSLARLSQEGLLDPEEIDEEAFRQHLYTRDLPDPDLLIRTSGEMRISNFLLWQLAYAELYVTPVLWPDFTARDLEQAILAYQRRERRFGMTSEQRRRGALAD